MRVFCVFMVLLGITFLGSTPVYALPFYQAGTSGNDISWPEQNCQAQRGDDIAFGIIGINGGLDFKHNNCAVSEASKYPNYSLYLNTGYPGVSAGRKYQHSPRECAYYDSACLAYNYGYNAVRFSLSYADLHNLHTTHWWLDVETDNSWASSAPQNIASLQGMIDALKKNVPLVQIGFYAYPGQWDFLTDDWHNNYPAWSATGSDNLATALRFCRQPSFTGGPIVLSQYTKKLDINYVCRDS
jgi:hypothetical protein